jgi:hypothetical protein
MENLVDSPRERDQSVERLLRQALKAPRRAAVTDLCLDPETLAAWVDGHLSGEALDGAQRHLADCARCQDLVGTLARINSTVPLTKPVRASRQWLAWLVPLTAVAAAAAVWVALPGNHVRDAALPQAPTDEVAALRAPENVPPDNRPRALEAPREPAAPPAASPEAAPLQAAPPQAAAPSQASPRPSGIAKQGVSSSDAAKDEVARGGDNSAGGRLEAENLKKAAGVSRESAAPARFAARAAEAARVEIVSSDPSVRWRIVGSAVERSVDGGSTWDAASTGLAAELTAGAAPSATVCWLVGRGGVVLLTTDGRTWRRVAFPEMTDLSAVRATDAGALVVSVSTADGRTFVTTDGGATWVVR